MRDGSMVNDGDLKKVLEAVREILAIQSSAIYVSPRRSRLLFSSRRVRSTGKNGRRSRDRAVDHH